MKSGFNKTYILILISITFILVSVFFYFSVLKTKPDFSKSNWVINIAAENNDGVTIYYKTSEKFKIGDIIPTAYLFTKLSNEKYIKLPLRVYNTQKDYVVIKIPTNQVNLECVKLFTDAGEIIDASVAIEVDWFPIMDWGCHIDADTWKAEYLKYTKVN